MKSEDREEAVMWVGELAKSLEMLEISIKEIEKDLKPETQKAFDKFLRSMEDLKNALKAELFE